MLFSNLPIKRKLTLAILIASGTVLFLTCAAFFSYEILRFRQVTVEKISILSEIVASNSTAALAFDSPEEAAEILTALKAEKYIVSASLYNKEGKLFSFYPETIDTTSIPSAPEKQGYKFTRSHLEIFQPVIQGTRELGTLYIKYDLDIMYQRFQLYGIIAFSIIIVCGIFAYLLSNILQKSISAPILSLAETAKSVSYNQNYSVRAPKVNTRDEVSVLTDAFNQMLEQIQQQNNALKEYNLKLEQSTMKLAKSEEQFRHTLDNMMEGAQIIGFDWKYIYVNDALVKHGKHSRDEMIGYTVMEKYPGIEQTPTFKLYERCFNERVPFHVENEFTFPDGSTGWFELSFQPVPEGIFILSIDITERKKAEAEIKELNTGLEKKVQERTAELAAVNTKLESSMSELAESEKKYRLLFNSLDEGYCIIEMIFDEHNKPVDYRFLEINAAFERQTGLSNAVGKRMREFAPNHEDHWFETYGKIALTGEAIRFENRAEQLQRWYDVYALRFGDPKNLQVAIVFNDITERKKAAEQLTAANKELEAFSYSVSHDLRAPLRAINGFSDMLAKQYTDLLDADAKRLLGVIKTNALGMGQLIDDLLQFSRTGRKDVVLAKVDMKSMAFAVAGELTQNNPEKMNKIIIKDLPVISCDMQLMRQVWANLISNALKYSSKKENPEIEIGATEKEGEIIYYVKDNGAGFDMQYAEKLFGVFQRLHSQKEFEGTGVGLALVQRIIAKHGGKVWAESELDKGACFYFSLKTIKDEVLISN